MRFDIRDASSGDVPALARLHVETFNETHRGGRDGGPTYALREQQWRKAFTVTDGSWFCFVVEEVGGGLVGFARGTPHDGGVPGFIGMMFDIGHADGLDPVLAVPESRVPDGARAG
jgi:hypothetical protein